MGAIHHVSGMFHGVSYNKFTTQTVREKMTAKIAFLIAKVEERRGRVSKIMLEHKITPEALSDVVIQYMKDQKTGSIARNSYVGNTHSPEVRFSPVPGTPDALHVMETGKLEVREVLVPAGVVANIVREKELMESETEETHRMGLIVRNLKDTEPFINPTTYEVIQRHVVHTLSDDEIEYLGL